jgi:hypothetical protein
MIHHKSLQPPAAYGTPRGPPPTSVAAHDDTGTVLFMSYLQPGYAYMLSAAAGLTGR